MRRYNISGPGDAWRRKVGNYEYNLLALEERLDVGAALEAGI
jgi:hypothetical protein